MLTHEGHEAHEFSIGAHSAPKTSNPDAVPTGLEPFVPFVSFVFKPAHPQHPITSG
jgi:hypothetical protein